MGKRANSRGGSGHVGGSGGGPGRGAGSGGGTGRNGSFGGARSTATVGRNIVSAPKSGGNASTAQGSRAVAGAAARPGSSSGLHRGAEAEDLRAAVLGIFHWCDADADGVLSATEFAAAQRLIAELCPGDFDEEAATEAFEKASDGGTGSLVDEDGFLRAMQVLIQALPLPQHELIAGLKRQTSKRSTAFDRSVTDFSQALVRNVSNLVPEEVASAPPPPSIWRTTTGGHSFPLPPGADGGPLAAGVAFKMMQFLAMRTEDATVIAPHLAGQMMGHRQMFKQMLDMTGDVQGVQVVKQGPGPTVVDVFLAKHANAEQWYRVRISGMQLSADANTRLIGMGGFEPAPIDPTDVPQALREAMAMHGGAASGPDLSALGTAPPPAALSRQTSLLADGDLEGADLALTATPVARHLFRLTFKLADSPLPPAPTYVLLVPRLKVADSGHPRYTDHEIRVSRTGGVAPQPQIVPFDNFVVINVRSHVIPSLIVEHEFTSCRVRVQLRSAARRSEIVPVPNLSPEERVNCLAVDPAQAAELRKLLASQGLARRNGERDIAFAVRLGRALREGYDYDVAITEAHLDSLPLLIWAHRRGDCSAFNVGFVYALRAFGVPARGSLGFKYGRAVKQACGSFVGPHCESEFFVEDVGWVPCDATLGIKRLGHEGGSMLSFVEWRPAALSLAEAEELAWVIRSAKDPVAAQERLQKGLEDRGGKTLSAADLAVGLAREYSLPGDVAEKRCQQVLRHLGLGDQGRISAEQFSRGIAAFELGVYRELGGGDALSCTSKAGAKMYEGGPFRNDPLEMQRLKENMMVPDDIEEVLDYVGGGQKQPARDWGSMWPYGVFLCHYDFEEKPLN